MTTSPDNNWVRTPQQVRARRTFEEVLTARAELLAERGYDGFSISEVCRRAAVSPGALYDWVNGKDEPFLAVHERELDRMATSAQAQFAPAPRWSALPIPRLVAEAIRQLARHYLDNQSLLKAFVLRAAVDDRVRTEGSPLAGRTATAVVDLHGLRHLSDDARQLTPGASAPAWFDAPERVDALREFLRQFGSTTANEPRTDADAVGPLGRPFPPLQHWREPLRAGWRTWGCVAAIGCEKPEGPVGPLGDSRSGSRIR